MTKRKDARAMRTASVKFGLKYRAMKRDFAKIARPFRAAARRRLLRTAYGDA